MKYDTPGRQRLERIGKGPTELFQELKKAVPTMPIDVSTVSRWRSGDMRPEAFWRAAMSKVWGIKEPDWFLPEEREALRATKRAA